MHITNKQVVSTCIFSVMFVKLNEKEVLEFCQERGFRVSVRAFWVLEAAVVGSALPVGDVLQRAGQLNKKVITESDMKQLLADGRESGRVDVLEDGIVDGGEETIESKDTSNTKSKDTSNTESKDIINIESNDISTKSNYNINTESKDTTRTSMKDTYMECEYSEEEEIKRLRQLIQIILNKR